MKIYCDYHMHTPLCGHAVGQPEEYARRAIKVGVKEIGFTDHAPLVNGRNPKVSMSHEQLPHYHQMMEKVKEEFKDDLSIKIAIEADFIPGYEDKIKEIIDGYPYDFVIGSVHFIKDWGFDNPDQRDKWDDADTDAIYKDYYELLRESAKTRMYDIIGHADLVKKFGYRATEDLTDEVKETAKVFKECGVAVEINTSGLRKPVGEMYPSLKNLKIYCQAGVSLTFGSDAHDPQDVGRDFDRALQLARDVGFKEYLVFKQRKVEKVIKI